jgi:hypothetical protein
MNKEFICGHEKYMLSGPKRDTIILPVFFSNLPVQIEVNGHALSLKPDFHVSLICIGKIIEKHNVTIPNFIEKIEKDFCNFTKQHKIEVIRYKSEFKFASENDRRTIIAMCDVSNLNNFFDLINQKYSLNVEHPPTHVTLYALDGKGIYLTDSKDIEKLTKSVKLKLTLK